jgi:hypothetical protein
MYTTQNQGAPRISTSFGVLNNRKHNVYFFVTEELCSSTNSSDLKVFRILEIICRMEF